MRYVVLTSTRRMGRWTRPHPVHYSWPTAKTYVTRDRVYTYVYAQWWGVSLFSVTRDKVCYRQWPEVACYEDLYMIAKMAPRVEGPPPPHVAPLESKVLGKYDGLIAHCAATAYTDGDARVPGIMLIQAQGHLWVVELRDHDTARRLRVLAATLDAAIAQANQLVSQPDAPWEQVEWLEGKQTKKKKK